jgi:hypothetical protein
MRAVRLSAPGPAENLRLTTLPLPPEREGWVRVRVDLMSALAKIYRSASGLPGDPVEHDDPIVG